MSENTADWCLPRLPNRRRNILGQIYLRRSWRDGSSYPSWLSSLMRSARLISIIPRMRAGCCRSVHAARRSRIVKLLAEGVSNIGPFVHGCGRVLLSALEHGYGYCRAFMALICSLGLRWTLFDPLFVALCVRRQEKKLSQPSCPFASLPLSTSRGWLPSADSLPFAVRQDSR
jgi:hypothetical protein